jgi:multisubunit Na+/H+ antiporter MnhE subunit
MTQHPGVLTVDCSLDAQKSSLLIKSLGAPEAREGARSDDAARAVAIPDAGSVTPA